MNPAKPLRVLVLCTGNSARSQMAEALLNSLGRGRIDAHSAGTRPSAQVHPLALETLARYGIPAPGHAPRGIDHLAGRDWDIVLTVCDNARESCPVFPGGPVTAHWGMPDPTEAESDAARRAAFNDAFVLLRQRIARMLALPVDQLEHSTLAAGLNAIGRA